jgi:acyl carrier protein
MEIKEFIENLSGALEMDSNLLSSETVFKDLSNWDSLAALNLIAMVDDIYKVPVGGDDIDNSETIFDLWQVIKQRI